MRLEAGACGVQVGPTIVTMAAVQIPLEEYLSTTYHPDCDYVDGELLERNVGEKNHARFQTRLIRLLGDLEQRLGIWVVAELRLQVRPDRFRVPDVMVTRSRFSLERMAIGPASSWCSRSTAPPGPAG